MLNISKDGKNIEIYTTNLSNTAKLIGSKQKMRTNDPSRDAAHLLERLLKLNTRIVSVKYVSGPCSLGALCKM